MVKKVRIGLAGVLSMILLAGAPALAAQPGNSNPHNKVTICHATGSAQHPYQQITVNANGSVSGHAGNSHQHGQDIIPPFAYNDGGSTKHFAGQNWDVQGQAIYKNDCHAGGRGGGGATQSTTAGPNNAAGGQTSNQAATVGVSGATTATGATGAQVVPRGGVAAGDGGAKVTSVASVAGLLGSVATLGTGLALFRRT